MESIKLSRKLIISIATSPINISGAVMNNIIYDLNIQDNIKPLEKNNNLNEDTTYRVNIEWNEIEPEKGQFCEKSINKYRDILTNLNKCNITPLVILHNFKNPVWFDEQDGWFNDEASDLFERYVEYVILQLGELVVDWITFDQPNKYLINTYLIGKWPPYAKSMIDYSNSSKNIILAHIKSYTKIHYLTSKMSNKKVKVGAVINLKVFESANNNIFRKLMCRIYCKYMQENFIKGFFEGKFDKIIGYTYPLGKGEYIDFLGIDCNDKDFTGLSNKYYIKYKLPVYIIENENDYLGNNL